MPMISVLKKRPCRICGKWYRPNPRVGDSQKTCSDPDCKREWHKKQCARWNKSNKEYFKAIYLSKKLEEVKKNSAVSDEVQGKNLTLPPRLKLGLPRKEVQEAIGLQHLVIIEYIAQLLMKRFQEVIRV